MRLLKDDGYWKVWISDLGRYEWFEPDNNYPKAPEHEYMITI